MTQRLDWDDYFLGIADSVAVRADCTRRKVGAVVVDPSTKHIIATGYNGSPPGEPGCLSDGACPRGKHYKTNAPAKWTMEGHSLGLPYNTIEVCPTCHVPWPCEFAVAPGSSYDTGKGSCIALHAEQNATIRAGVQAVGAWIYITDEPCVACLRLMKGAGYTKITWYGGEWTSATSESSLKLWTCTQALAQIANRWFSRSGKPTRS